MMQPKRTSRWLWGLVFAAAGGSAFLVPPSAHGPVVTLGYLLGFVVLAWDFWRQRPKAAVPQVLRSVRQEALPDPDDDVVQHLQELRTLRLREIERIAALTKEREALQQERDQLQVQVSQLEHRVQLVRQMQQEIGRVVGPEPSER